MSKLPVNFGPKFSVGAIDGFSLGTRYNDCITQYTKPACAIGSLAGLTSDLALTTGAMSLAGPAVSFGATAAVFGAGLAVSEIVEPIGDKIARETARAFDAGSKMLVVDPAKAAANTAKIMANPHAIGLLLQM